MTLISSQAWNEGGSVVALERGVEPWVMGAATWGHHPYVFVYDPRPIWRALREGKTDVLDIHEEPASLAVAEVLLLELLARRGRTPVSLFCAQNIEKRYPPPFRWLERIALRRADGVHTCNEEAGRILRRKGFRGVLVNLGLGVDTDRFQSVPAPSAPSDETFRVGYVGRLERHKGISVLVEAIAHMPGVHLDIVGEGPEHTVVDRRIAALDLTDRVRIRGFVAQEELPDLYRSFDVLVVPSLETPSWVEQFGRVAVEAMASGVPVVASASGALPEVLDGCGLLVPPGDPSALIDALAQLKADPALRTRLADAGHRRAQDFSWPVLADRHLTLFEEMVR